MPILIMGIVAWLVFTVIVFLMVAAGIEEGHERAQEEKTKKYQGKAVKAA